ncbi:MULTISPECIES: hypothetical protein [unclassified Streptomyces]|uniref:hypothetical protein n=1 Tax=unclassified Streptomyces TaxID=2593676 RepID=UPI0004BD1DBC|nr:MULTISPECIES: hypothetical protein [unclassified Streptomyces]
MWFEKVADEFANIGVPTAELLAGFARRCHKEGLFGMSVLGNADGIVYGVPQAPVLAVPLEQVYVALIYELAEDTRSGGEGVDELFLQAQRIGERPTADGQAVHDAHDMRAPAGDDGIVPTDRQRRLGCGGELDRVRPLNAMSWADVDDQGRITVAKQQEVRRVIDPAAHGPELEPKRLSESLDEIAGEVGRQEQ